MISIYARIAAVAALLVLLAGIGWKIDQGGYKRSQAERTAEMLVMSETARLREQAAQKSNERVDRDYQTAKTRLVADNRITTERLREFKAAIKPADSIASATSSLDDPRDTIIDSCAAALVGMDEYAKGVASKATALQSYAANVCMK